MIKLRIKKGDKVVVTTGKDRGQTGDVVSVLPKENKVLVSGINLVKRHQKPSKDSEGGIISKEMPMNISNVAIVDPKSGKATKVGYKFLTDGTKVRYAKLSGEILDKETKK